MDGKRNRLLGLNQKKILKPDAVPSVNFQLQDNGEDVSSRSERKRKRSILQETKIILKCLRHMSRQLWSHLLHQKLKIFAHLALKRKKKMHYFWKELDFLIMKDEKGDGEKSDEKEKK
ncbi:hypothetical protein AVEN_103663-1 [Araneus ventricosus]|uniref:Uncharacterized protein n=1 Tax=Araneus ventricosus TaxID=182803 RepID=A0A4Y2N8L3_ARAVE|nr:hypothetical protein AVEN_103663-1 [Araneus ventricosus]